MPLAILEYDARHPLELMRFASGEAQVAAIADDIAYDAHDIDDGTRSGLLDARNLREVDFLAGLLDDIEAETPKLAPPRLVNELVRRVITRFVEDVIAESRSRLVALSPRSADDIRAGVIVHRRLLASNRGGRSRHQAPLVSARLSGRKGDAACAPRPTAFLRDLFTHFFAAPELMPAEWGEGLDGADEARRARRIADYIAGMTDRYAAAEHARLSGRDTTPGEMG